jgi:hypothetical protein
MKPDSELFAQVVREGMEAVAFLGLHAQTCGSMQPTTTRSNSSDRFRFFACLNHSRAKLAEKLNLLLPPPSGQRESQP